MTKENHVAPIIGEIAKVTPVTKLMAVDGCTVSQTVDGEWMALKLPITMPDGTRLIVAINHTLVDELLDTMKITAEEMFGVRQRRRAA